MDLLVIGGTAFVGRHFVEAARARGHRLTLFHRGKTNAGLFPDVERIIGDRDGGLGALAGRRWDAVLDTCGYLPRVVRSSADLLRDAAGHYTFVSSISVYDESADHITEETPVGTLEDDSVEIIDGTTYGPLKALCERAVLDVFGARALVVRPGLIVGPFDPTDRFTYWPRRIRRGGTVLAPGRPEAPVQFIDARDLAEWMARAIEEGLSGVFNATGPVPAVTMGDLLETCREALRPDAELLWVDEEFLIGREVGPWMELPLWLPEHDAAGLMRADVSKAVAAGLTFRPVRLTVEETAEWDAGRSEEPRAGVGLAPEREASLLDEWRARSGTSPV